MLFSYIQSDERVLIKRLALILVLEKVLRLLCIYICTCIYVYVISESVGLLCEQ